MAHTIPTLSPSPSWESAVAYLRWLDASEWSYHLDDDATDLGFPEDVGAALSRNADILAANFGWEDIWNAYHPIQSSGRSGRA